VPSQPTVKKYYNLEFVGEVEATMVQEGVYCVVEELHDVGHYGYIAKTGDGGYDVVNLHVIDPFSPPESITTYVLVVHEEDNPPETAKLIGPEGEETVNVSGLEAELSYVGPITLGSDTYWLKLRWADGMQLVLTLFPWIVVTEDAKKIYRRAKRLFLWANLQLMAGRRGFIPFTGPVE